MESIPFPHPNNRNQNTHLMKITINEPCHENWEAMTPNQQGAFCGSCQKSVVDFSKKTLEEIKNFFSEPKGKVCGRFEEKQLQELTFDDFFARFRYWNFSKKFATIFILAFGFWIFSNSSSFAQNNERFMMKGDVAVEHNEGEKNTIKGNITKVNPVCKETDKPKQVKKDPEPKIEKEEIQVRMGMVAYHPVEKKDPVTKTTEVNDEKEEIKEVKNEEVIEETQDIPPLDEEPSDDEPIYVMGETSDTPPPIDIDEVQQVTLLNTICEINTIDAEDEIQLLPVPTVTETVVPETIQPQEEQEQKTIAEEKEVRLFPNPNNGNFIVEVGHKQIMRMYDETGKELITAQEVEGSTSINTTFLKPGVYFISLSDKNGIITKKVIIND